MTTDQQQTETKPEEESAPEAPPENFTVVTTDTPQMAAEEGAEPEAAAEGEGEAEATEAEAKGDEEAEAGDIPEGVKKNLARARQRAREAEAKARSAEERLAELQAQREADEAAEELDPNDFDTYEAYLEAKAEAKPKSARQKAADKAGEKGEGESEEAEAVDGVSAKDLQAATVSLHDQIADVDEEFAGQLVAKDNPLGLTITAPMVVALNDADDPAGVLKHLAEKPELSEEIAAMPPKKMERRLLKLELELANAEAKKATTTEAKAETTARKASSAPEPIRANTGRQQTVRTPEQALAQGDFKTYEKLRNDEEAKRGPGSW